MDEASEASTSTAVINDDLQGSMPPVDDVGNDDGSAEVDGNQSETKEDLEKKENIQATPKEEIPPSESLDTGTSNEHFLQNKSIIEVILSADVAECEDHVLGGADPENIACQQLVRTPSNSIRPKRKIKNKYPLEKGLDSDDQEQGEDFAYSVGKRVEAKDYGEVWHPARIVEVDSDEIEVLVHYDNWSQRHDEWISMSSPRIRSLSALTSSVSTPTATSEQSVAQTKATVKFKVGERCLARWTDNRRFPATVRSVVGNGKYEMIFDDGYILICPWYSLSKLKNRNSTLVATNSLEPSSSRKRSIPSLPPPVPLPPVPFHRHLFDPSRDYLGPKSERREMKRKLDVKALFNIGRRNSTTTNILKRKKPIPTEDVPPVKKKKVGRKKKNDSLDTKSELTTAAPIESLKPKTTVHSVLKEKNKRKPEGVSATNEESFIHPEPLHTNDDSVKTLVTNKNNVGDIDQNLEHKEQPGDTHDMEVVQASKNEIIEDYTKIKIKKTDKPLIDPSTITPKTKKKKHKEKANKGAHLTQHLHENTILMHTVSNVIPKDKKVHILEGDFKGAEERVVEVANPYANVDADNVTAELTAVESVLPSVIKASDGTLKIVVHPLAAEETKAPRTASSENIPNKVYDSYSMDIDEGLKLIAEAVESFSRSDEAELASKSIFEEESASPSKETEMSVVASAQECLEAVPEEGQWCCRWVNGEPQGVCCDLDTDSPAKGGGSVLPRKSVLVEDKRLPPGWQKIMVRRSSGTSAGKWDIVLIEPTGKRLRDKGEMRNYLSIHDTEELRKYENILMDFSVHRKLSRRLGWDTTVPGGVSSSIPVALPRGAPATPPHAVGASTPPGLRLSLSVKKKAPIRTPTSIEPPSKKKKKGLVAAKTLQGGVISGTPTGVLSDLAPPVATSSFSPTAPQFAAVPPVAGHVYVGSMKVQIIDNLFRCPAEGCFKNFRKDNLLRMHIKHYHRELRKFLGSTPKVSDLAYARTAIPDDTVVPKLKCEGDTKVPKPKLAQKISTTPVDKVDKKDSIGTELHVDTVSDGRYTPVKVETDQIQPSVEDSPKLRSVLENPLPNRRPKVLFPANKMEVKSEQSSPLSSEKFVSVKTEIKPKEDMEAVVKLQKLPDNQKSMITPEPAFENLDFETAISSHTVTKPVYWSHRPKSSKKKSAKIEKKKGKAAAPTPAPSEAVWEASELDTRSSYSTPDSRGVEKKPDALAEPTSPPPQPPPAPPHHPDYLISETGEKIKIVRMKREEIINCHCGFGEEDGLMIQCDLCLCWQHSICHNIETESQVPDKYTCSICLNPRRGRRSRRFMHDQAWLYEGALPGGGGAPDAALRRSHELTANLLRLSHVLHTLRLKFHIAEKKDHPKLYLWAKDWEGGAVAGAAGGGVAVEPLVDLNAVFGEIGKENLPLKEEDIKDVSLGDIRTTLSEEVGDSQKDDGHLGSLANLLSSPGGGTLDLAISTSELERLAKSVQDSEVGRNVGPEPEAPIESSACRRNLLRHILRYQLLIDARLDSIEAQVAELESQEPSLEDDETPEFFPRTKQTIQMLHRDLDTLEELGLIT